LMTVLLGRFVARTFGRSGQSSPGPDGVPYAAWRRLGPLAVDTLHAAALELASAQGAASLLSAFPLDGNGNTDFDLAILVFIPKKVDREVNGIRYCEPGDVRPLAIVNTDNRLMANAVRCRVEPLLEKAISAAQRGFLLGRSMLQNVVELDCEMRAASLQRERAAAVFFDFAAAFPSLAHDFMMDVLSFLASRRALSTSSRISIGATAARSRPRASCVQASASGRASGRGVLSPPSCLPSAGTSCSAVSCTSCRRVT